MELQASKRSTLQTTYAPISYASGTSVGQIQVPERADPGVPAMERGALLRSIALWRGTIERAVRATSDAGHSAVLAALATDDPLALAAAIHTHDTAASGVVRDLTRELVALQAQAVRDAVAQLDDAIAHLEDRLVSARADRVVRALGSGASSTLGAKRNPQEQKVPDAKPWDEREVMAAAPAPPAGLRDDAVARVRRLAFPPARSRGARADRVVRAAEAQGMDASSVTALVAAFGVATALQIDPAIAAWQRWGLQFPQWVKDAVPAQPFGYLHLERMDYIPSGIEHGELVASIPLAPAEEVDIVHKEWANTDEEFSKLIDDQFEDYSEKGVVQNTDLTSSSSSQAQHSSNFSVSVSASGGFGPVSTTVGTSYSAQQSDMQSRQASTHEANGITQKASARSKSEHRISFRLAKRTGVEDETVRHIKNPDPVHPVRYDFYQLMRRWRVDLRRYGIRLTYDLTIPEPGIDLLAPYLEAADVARQLDEGFTFELVPDDITYDTWEHLAGQYGVKIDPPPPLYQAVQGTKISGPYEPGQEHVDELRIKCPEGYEWYGTAQPGQSFGQSYISVLRTNAMEDQGQFSSFDVHTPGMNPMSSDVGFAIFTYNATEALLSVRAFFGVLDATYASWQLATHATLRKAASDAFDSSRQLLEQRRTELLARVAAGDALTLRKLEREELMKNVLRWLFGPGFEFAPPAPKKGYFDDSGAVVNASTASGVLSHGRLVSFLHQALEWENLNSFLYPYFWTPRARWDNRLAVRHDDSIHEAFLRAGAARVILPIRRGWENAFLALLATGSITSTHHPYMTIAEEIENYARTNYPGITPANNDDPTAVDPAVATAQAEGHLVASWYEYTPTSALDIKVGETSPTEGEFTPPTFAPPPPDKPWWLDPEVGDRVAAILASLANRLG